MVIIPDSVDCGAIYSPAQLEQPHTTSAMSNNLIYRADHEIPVTLMFIAGGGLMMILSPFFGGRVKEFMLGALVFATGLGLIAVKQYLGLE